VILSHHFRLEGSGKASDFLGTGASIHSTIRFTTCQGWTLIKVNELDYQTPASR